MCRETVPEIGGGDWKGPLADSNEVVRWHCQFQIALIVYRTLNTGSAILLKELSN